MTRAMGLGQLIRPAGEPVRQPLGAPRIADQPIPDFGSGLPCQHPDVDPDLFFPTTVWLRGSGMRELSSQAAQITAAKALCSRCPAIAACGAWAIPHGELGIWGGLTEGDRGRLRRQRRGGVT